MLVLAGGAVLGVWARPAPPSALEARIELLLYRPGVTERVLTRGGEASYVLLLTAIRASMQLGASTPLPAGTPALIEAAFESVGADDPAFSFGALEDLRALQQAGVLSDVALPASLYGVIRTAATRELEAEPSADPNVASDRLVTIRAARSLGIGNLPATDSIAWCSLADEAMAAARVDVAAVFAELAGPEPTACASTVSMDSWAERIRSAASTGEIHGMSYFAPTLLSDARSHELAVSTLSAMEPDIAAGNLSFRTVELATRLARKPIDLARVPNADQFLRRQILLQGSVADGMAVGDWDRIVTAGVTSLAGLRGARGDAPTAGTRPLSTLLGDDSGMGLLGASALRPADSLGLPSATSQLVAEAARIPGLLPAIVLRTGDCAYLQAADLDEAVTTSPGPDLLVRFALAAKAAETCGREAALVERLRSSVLEAAASARQHRVGELWASAEVGCLLGVPFGEDARTSGKLVGDAYVASVIGPEPYPDYTSENLYAALRLRDLAASGCDGDGWWTGIYASP
jgi:hypothetical protein